MAFTTYTLSGPLQSLLGDGWDNTSRVHLWLESSEKVIPDPTVTGGARLGGEIRAEVAEDGTFTMTGIPATVDGAPLYRLRLEAQGRGATKNTKAITGWFEMTADRTLAWVIANTVTPAVVDATVVADINAALAIPAQVAEDRAFIEARVVEDLGTTDGQTKALIETPSSETAVALSATIAGASQRPGDNTRVGLDAYVSDAGGAWNVAIGVSALKSNATGLANTAVGMNALMSSTAANNNTALGFASLQNNASGSNNMAIGTNALNANTTGSLNTAVGMNALKLNVSANGSTAVGYAALTASTGELNTAVGHIVLTSNTTGVANTAVGDSALFSNTTGDTNTGIGQLALGQNTSGSQNSALGHGALYGVQTGGVNTGVGMEAGHRIYDGTASDSIHGDRNTFVGGRATVAVGSDPSYTVAVGFGTQVGGNYATAIGGGSGTAPGARALHAGSVAIGTDSSGGAPVTTAADQFILGTANHRYTMPGLPTSNPGVGTGILWNDGGVVKVA